MELFTHWWAERMLPAGGPCRRCESPIEVAMFLALKTIVVFDNDDIYCPSADAYDGCGRGVFLETQATVGTFRVDQDRERDRALVSLGYEVFRYTGSDIWKDVFKCAQEALDRLRSKARALAEASA